MKKPEEFSSIEELEQGVANFDKKFKISATAMWASLPFTAIFTITTILGFVSAIPWIAFSSLCLIGGCVVSMGVGMAMAFKYSNKEEDLEREIKRRELAESMKAISKTQQISKEYEIQAEKNLTKKKKDQKENLKTDNFNV